MEYYKVTLTKEEREQLKEMLNKGKRSTQQFRNACILLNCDRGPEGSPFSNEHIAQMLQVTPKTIERVKKRFVEEGYEACLERKAYPPVRELKADGDFEARLIALSCSTAPQGRSRWSLRLLADTMVELKFAESISHETIRQVLKKTKLSLGR